MLWGCFAGALNKISRIRKTVYLQNVQGNLEVISQRVGSWAQLSVPTR